MKQMAKTAAYGGETLDQALPWQRFSNVYDAFSRGYVSATDARGIGRVLGTQSLVLSFRLRGEVGGTSY
jgi:hypothetical protein